MTWLASPGARGAATLVIRFIGRRARSKATLLACGRCSPARLCPRRKITTSTRYSSMKTNFIAQDAPAAVCVCARR